LTFIFKNKLNKINQAPNFGYFELLNNISFQKFSILMMFPDILIGLLISMNSFKLLF